LLPLAYDTAIDYAFDLLSISAFAIFAAITLLPLAFHCRFLHAIDCHYYAIAIIDAAIMILLADTLRQPS
jgi:hypothetical protein